MKSKLPAYMPLIFFLIGGLLAFFIRSLSFPRDIDVTAVNRITKEVELNWGNPERGDYSSSPYSFCVTDLNGTLLYQSKENTPATMNEALKNGDAVTDIMKDGKLAGKVIIHVNPNDSVLQFQKKLSISCFLIFTLFSMLSGIYYFFLYRSVIRPFVTLKSFASQVSKGNLNFPLPMDHHNIFGAFTESFDLMRHELLLARQKEYLANQSKKELAASLSHDIKTPITSIKVISELLMVLIEEAPIRNKIETINEKAEQINALVTDLFHSAMEDLEELKVTPVETYSSSLPLLIQNADYLDLVLLSPVPDCMLIMDELRFTQVIGNIIHNSYKYANTPITITSRLSSSQLELTVKDYGKGVLTEELPLLFNKCYRGQNAATESGSGLGLYISKQLLNKMEGDIYCSNDEDGFTVLILLKLVS